MLALEVFSLFQSTPSAWRETTASCVNVVTSTFQSTPSAWRETCPSTRLYISSVIISIHSLRMEGDGTTIRRSGHSAYFNPLPPHGGRQKSNSSDCPEKHISIHSLRMEGDCAVVVGFSPDFISIHSLRMEGDGKSHFSRFCENISIHSLRMEGDRNVFDHFRLDRDFNPLPPHGGRP